MLNSLVMLFLLAFKGGPHANLPTVMIIELVHKHIIWNDERKVFVGLPVSLASSVGIQDVCT